MEIKEFLKYLQLLEKDRRLTVWHLALLIAILQLFFKQGQPKIVKVSRRKIMQLAHVKTLPTYHKYFKELQEMGYCKYNPSYHPGFRSELELLIKP